MRSLLFADRRLEMKLLMIFPLILTLTSSVFGHYSASSDSFHDVFHSRNGRFYDSTNAMLSSEVVEHMYEEMFEKAECTEKSNNCTQCLENLVSVFVSPNISTLDQWNAASTAALYAVLDPAQFCNMSLADMENLNAVDTLVGFLNANKTAGLGEEEIESLLEALEDGFSGVHHHEEDHHEEDHHEESTTTTTTTLPTTTLSNATTESHADDDHHGEEEDHHEEAKCFGEGTVLQYMELDHEERITAARIPELAGILVSFLVQDWVVNDNCTVLPTQEDILADLFLMLGENGQLIDEEGFEQLLEKLNIGSIPGVVAPTESSHSGHAHKRSIDYLTRNRRSADNEPSLTDQCMSEGTLASVYDLELDAGITRDQFIQLCPALIQQQISGSCLPAAVETTTKGSGEAEVTVAERYGYGTLAVIAISLLALLGVLLIPCLNKTIVQYILSMLVAMGVATLLADSLLHLVPLALGLHSHGDHDHAEDEPLISDALGVQLVVLAAIYGFWLFETLMAVFRPKSVAVVDVHGQELSESEPAGEEKIFHKKGEEGSAGSGSTLGSAENGKSKKISSVALMLVFGDALHNFIDGIAVGAAFSLSLREGLGTSIAIFCHELPHELGDFAILLKVGVSKFKAVLFNLATGVMCLIGLFVGVAIGTADENAAKWLVAIAAGMFMYIALVDMMPQMLVPNKRGKWWIHFIMQNIGMFVGCLIMLLIAMFEDKIVHLA